MGHVSQIRNHLLLGQVGGCWNGDCLSSQHQKKSRHSASVPNCMGMWSSSQSVSWIGTADRVLEESPVSESEESIRSLCIAHDSLMRLCVANAGFTINKRIVICE